MACVLANFYQFFSFPLFKEFQQPLKQHCLDHGLKGTILLAPEGINTTLVGPEKGVKMLLKYIQTIVPQPIETQLFWVDNIELFQRMKVRLKREIIRWGQALTPYDPIGTYIDPQNWNQFITQPDVVTIDTRNEYETKEGAFKGAFDPKINHFSDFVTFVHNHLDIQRHKKVALYCTGGIRCEKATSFLRKQGFDHVYQLKGGVINYLKTIPNNQSLWQGRCFVFDDRQSVSHDDLKVYT